MQIVENDGFTVRRPNERHQLGWFRTWLVMGANVWQARGLIWQLFKRDFLASYKKSFVGFAWIFLTPLLGIVSWVMLQKTGLLNPGETPIPYPAYVLIGTSMFGLFLELFKGASQTLVAGSSLVMQVNYPHEALLFQQLAHQLARFAISLVVNLGVLLAFGIVPHWTIVFFPLVVLPLFLLASGIGLVVSMFAVVAVDLSTILTMLMGLLLYATPIIYTGDVSSPFLQVLVKWNPLTYLVCSARDIIITGQLYHPFGYMVCSVLSVILFLISWRLFFVSEQRLVERIL
jgi:lipopolysaccharide transport system permease protein